MIHTQQITLQLDGITPADYIAHFVDADPALETSRLRSVAVEADAPSGAVVATVAWDGPPPAARVAATAAGLHLTADVVAVHSDVNSLPRPVPASPTPLALAA
jgi:hypothetical protein